MATTAVQVIDPSRMESIPAPVGLPDRIGQAFTKAMEEVCHLLESRETQARFAHIILTQLRSKPTLQGCTPDSIVTGIIEMAEHNLDPSAQNECWLIPYEGRATMQTGYGGLLKLAQSHSDVLDIWADEVCENDTYEYYGVNQRPKHVYPTKFGPRGAYIGYYAVALLSQGRERAVQLSVEEMRQHAKYYSKNHDKKVWGEGTGGGFRGMSLKTVLRKICNTKYIPVTGKVAQLLHKMDTMEGVIDAEVSADSAARRQQLEAGKSIATHIADLYGDDSRGSTVESSHAIAIETGEGIEWEETAPSLERSMGDPDAKEPQVYASAWRDTLEAHKDNPALQDGLRSKVRLALNPASATTDQKGFALASAVLDCLGAAQKETP